MGSIGPPRPVFPAVLAAAPVAILVATLAAGCTTQRASFPGQDTDQVWTALVAVAGTPDYGDVPADERWSVKENSVWLDPAALRIEIYRELVRTTDLGSTRPWSRQRTWRFRVRLEPGDPPTVEFRSRGVGAPLRALEEAERFFEDVSELLGIETAADRETGAATLTPADRRVILATRSGGAGSD